MTYKVTRNNIRQNNLNRISLYYKSFVRVLFYSRYFYSFSLPGLNWTLLHLICWVTDYEVSIFLFDYYKYSQISMSRSCGHYFYRFEYPKCKFICTTGNTDSRIKRVPTIMIRFEKAFFIEKDFAWLVLNKTHLT